MIFGWVNCPVFFTKQALPTYLPGHALTYVSRKPILWKSIERIQNIIISDGHNSLNNPTLPVRLALIPDHMSFIFLLQSYLQWIYKGNFFEQCISTIKLLERVDHDFLFSGRESFRSLS